MRLGDRGSVKPGIENPWIGESGVRDSGIGKAVEDFNSKQTNR